MVVVVHGASHPLAPAGGDGVEEEAPKEKEDSTQDDGHQPPRRRTVRVKDAADFKRARALFPLRPTPALSAVAFPTSEAAATATAAE